MVKQFQLYRWLRFLFLLIAGIIIVIKPTASVNVIIYLVSSYIAIYGILSIIDGLTIKKATGENNLSIGLGIGAIIIALVILAVAKILIKLVPPLLGIILIINGINQFRDSHDTRKYVNVTPWLDYFYSALMVAAGVVFILEPSRTLVLIYQLVGVILIVLAVFEFINSRLYRN
ncbi:DUF308 domain-containing protein [Lactobacillus terrae]|uniref:DUF308 domain-containing protein n=1 Tax=Lactobacillus terrae TaxID=2269374 RepID=UPI000C1B6836|nr:DUF308 domain-containing protein [Lactobacillus terrae]